MEEVVDKSLDQLTQLGPYAFVMTMICGAAVWWLARQFISTRDELLKSHENRVADGLAMQMVVKEATAAIVAQSAATQSHQAAIDRLSGEISRLSTEMARKA